MHCLAEKDLPSSIVGNYSFRWIKNGGEDVVGENGFEGGTEFVEQVWRPEYNETLIVGLLLKLGDIKVRFQGDAQ